MFTDRDSLEIKLGDFGFSSHIEENKNYICGTFGYFAPEILINKKYSQTSDIFSAAIIIYNLVTGNSIFKKTDSVNDT